MTARWNISELLSALTARGRQPAVISFGDGETATWNGAILADKALALACGLWDAGVNGGDRVALWAPNSPVWIVAALAVLMAGGVVVPIDDLADAEHFDAALKSSAAQLVFTTARHLEEHGEVLRATRVILINDDEYDGPAAKGWQSLLSEAKEDLPTPAPDDPALLSWTSGTTGSPKAFLLTHRNIATNVDALRKLHLVGSRDRALLPLPLHHAYPFIVGMLTTLSIGTTIVLPGGTTGPLLMRAMREAEVTTIIGVPRLYDAIWTALETRIATRGRTARLLWRALLRSARFVQRATRAASGTAAVRPGSTGNRYAAAAARIGRIAVGAGNRGHGSKHSAGPCSPDTGWRRPRRCSPAIGRKRGVRAASDGHSPTGRFASPTPTKRGSARSSCMAAQSQRATSTIPRPTKRHSHPMAGTGPAIWALSMATASCSSPAGRRRYSC